MGAEYIGRCDHLEAEDLEEFDETSEDTDYQEFADAVGSGEIDRLEEEYGYKGSVLTLEKDWHITYLRGQWKGDPAVCMEWSAYHHIWKID